MSISSSINMADDAGMESLSTCKGSTMVDLERQQAHATNNSPQLQEQMKDFKRGSASGSAMADLERQQALITNTSLQLQEQMKDFEVEETDEVESDDSNNLQLYQQLYNYATDKGKIDSFMETINNHDLDHAKARVQLLSRVSPQNNTFLHIAVSFGNAKLATEILQLHRRLLLRKNFEGDTALHIAAKAGYLDTVNTLLYEGPCTNNCTTKGIENNHNDDVLELLTMKNDEENTALHEALIHGHESVAKSLIGADPTVSFYANKEKKSPLYLAAEAGLVEILNLIDNGAAVENNANIHVRGKSPFHAAILGCRNRGKSPFHAAILGRRNKEVLKIISNMEAKFFMKSKDEKGRTPLHCAASTGYLEGVRFLLADRRRVSDSHRKDNWGTFPIHSASINGHVHVVQELLRHCPSSKELLNSSGQNILHVAAKCGKDNLVSYFLKNAEFQMLMNQRDKGGNTPLHLATKHHHPKVVYILAWDRRTTLQVLNGSDMTALDIAESRSETVASYNSNLTWKALKSAGVQRAHSLHVLGTKESSPQELLGQVGDSGGDIAIESEDYGTKVINSSRGFPHELIKTEVTDSSITGSKLPKETDRVNTLLVVATLVATVTFAAGFTMPGGYKDSGPNDEGMATMLTKSMFQVFVICNAIAMYSAILVAVCLIWAQLGDLNLVITALHLALPLLAIALSMMSLAFMAGVYVVVSNLHWLVYVVLIVGTLFMCIVSVIFIPLFLNTTSKRAILHYITYYLLSMQVLAGSNNNDIDED